MKREEDSGAKTANTQVQVNDEMTDLSLAPKDHGGGRRNSMAISDLYMALVRNEVSCPK